MMGFLKSRSARPVIITAAALAILCVILAALVLTKPKPKPASGEPVTADPENHSAFIVDKSADEVLSITVENSLGTFTLARQTRTKSSVNESGEPVTTNEFFWTSEELKGVLQSDSAVRNFLNDIASLPEQKAVEYNAEDFSKYGLDSPRATAVIRFDDGTAVEMRFGIRNPADDSGVYFALKDSRDVKLVNYYATAEVFSDVRQFAKLLAVDSKTPPETLSITRLEDTLELKMLPASGEGLADAFRFTSPISAEITAKKGKEMFYGVCGLTMKACEFLEQTDEILEECGLITPQAVVKFTIGETDYELKIGSDTETGYYATVSGIPGVYALAKEDAPWLNASVGELVSKKPISPYVFAVSSVKIGLPDGEFTFKNENETFTYNNSPLPSDSFREFFNLLTAELEGDELPGEIGEKTLAEITFNYKTDEYGTESDALSFYELDERSCAVVLNGTPLFAASKVHVEQIAEKVAALTGGANSTG